MGRVGAAVRAAFRVLGAESRPTPKASSLLPWQPDGTGGGQPIYRSAGQGRRTAGFYAPETGPLSSIIANGMLLRARSRALMRENPWARRVKRSLTANAVGTGIVPKFLFPNPAWARQARQVWDDWGEEADANGLVDVYGLQALVVGALCEAGEVFLRHRSRRATDDLAVPYQVQLLESEHVPYWYTMPLPDGGWIKAGIEFDALGRRRAYHLFPHHPGEFATQMSFEGYSLKRIPAEQITHVFLPERPEAVRGAPLLSASILRLKGIDEYDDAELDRKRMAAMISGVITLLDPYKAGDKFGPFHDDALDARGGGPFTEMEPGTIPVLGPGENFTPFPTADLGRSYGDFHDHNLRAIAADSPLSYEMVSCDLSKVNYSSLRAGTLEARRNIEQFIHQIVCFQFNRALLRRFLDSAVLSGALEAPDYTTRKREYRRVAWIPQGWQWVDPAKEVGAAVEEIRAGLTSRDRVVAERTGEDATTIEQEIAQGDTRIDALGLVLDSDPRQSVKPATGKSATTVETKVATQEVAQGGQTGVQGENEGEDEPLDAQPDSADERTAFRHRPSVQAAMERAKAGVDDERRGANG